MHLLTQKIDISQKRRAHWKKTSRVILAKTKPFFIEICNEKGKEK
jgi:hypothetical protein